MYFVCDCDIEDVCVIGDVYPLERLVSMDATAGITGTVCATKEDAAVWSWAYSKAAQYDTTEALEDAVWG